MVLFLNILGVNQGSVPDFERRDDFSAKYNAAFNRGVIFFFLRVDDALTAGTRKKNRKLQIKS